MRKKLHKFNDLFSWFILILSSVLLVVTIFTVTTAAKTGESVFLFGYRPVLVLTGSMEPYMMTNSVCLTEKVDSIDDIQVGDVITFHFKGENSKKILITHRIVSIGEDGFINTKGDNNNVTDNLPLTIDNVESKVVWVFNGTAWLASKWQSPSGKIMLLSFGAALILLYVAVKLFFSKPKVEADLSEQELADSNIEENRFEDSQPAEGSDIPAEK